MARLLGDLAANLAANGFRPALAGVSAESGHLFEERNGVLLSNRDAGNSRNANLITRALRLPLTWRAMIEAAQMVVRRDGPPDIVISLTDPPLLALLGDRIARRHAIPHIHWCMDLYPEILEAAGLLPAWNPLYKGLRGLAHGAMRRADCVVSIGRCMTERLSAAGCETVTIPNWRFVELSTRRPAWDAPFKVLYSGNIGRAHDFSALAEAVRLQGSDDKIQWRVRGSGPCAEEIGRLLPVAPPLTEEAYTDGLESASAHLITLKDTFLGLSVPSKLYNATAVPRPIIFVGPAESDTAMIIREKGLGAVVRPGDGRQLLETVRSFADDHVLWGETAARVAAFAETNGLEEAAPRFIEVLNALLRSKADG